MKRIITILIAVMMLLTATACSSDHGDEPKTTDGDNNITSTSTVSSVSDSGEETIPESPVIAENFGGETFQIAMSDQDGVKFVFNDMIADSTASDTLGQAVYKRCLYLENKYNISFEFTANSNWPSLFIKPILSNTTDYVLATPGIVNAMKIAAQGCALDLSELEYVDTTKEWWNQNFMKEVVFNGSYYFLIGDANLIAYSSVDGLFFNESVLNKYPDLPDLFTLVLNREWTYSKLMNICETVAADNGDGIYDDKDTYGMAVNSYAALTFTYGSGIQFVKVNDDGKADFSIGQDFITLFEKLIYDFNQSHNVINLENYQNKEEISQKMFDRDQILFSCGTLKAAFGMASRAANFSIVPMPLATDNQENYYHFIHETVSSSFVIPSILAGTQLDMASRVMEDMTYYSHYYVRPVFIENTIKVKKLNNALSGQMVDIILDTVHFNLDLVTGNSFTTSLRNMLTSGQSGIVSMITSFESVYENELNEFIEKLNLIG